MLRSILFAFAFIGVGSTIIVAIASGHGGIVLIASAFVAALLGSTLCADLRLLPPEAATLGLDPVPFGTPSRFAQRVDRGGDLCSPEQ
jgi:hypothetical protein